MPQLRPEGPARQGIVDLLNLVDKIETMAEIGCYAGESTQLFAWKTEQVLYAVDMWKDGYDKDHLLSDAWPMRDVEKAFDERVKSFGDKVVKCKMSSLEAAEKFKGFRGFDLVYIDGNHKFAYVVDDIRAWGPLVKPGGYIAGHDFTDARWKSEVQPAVHRVLGRPDRIFQDGSWIKQIGGKQ